MVAGLAVAAPPSTPHEHSWRLVSAEYDGSIEVREHLCTTCSAVYFD